MNKKEAEEIIITKLEWGVEILNILIIAAPSEEIKDWLEQELENTKLDLKDLTEEDKQE